jgi:hypothetical protein
MSFAVTRERPDSANCLFVGIFKPANSNAEYSGNFGRLHVHLTTRIIWLSEDLCIPLESVRLVRLIQTGWILRAYAMEIVFVNPETGAVDKTYLCDVNSLGIYRLQRLKDLKVALEKALREFTEYNPEQGRQIRNTPKEYMFPIILAVMARDVLGSQQGVELRVCVDWLGQLDPYTEPPKDPADVLPLLRTLLRKNAECPPDLPEKIKIMAISRRILCAYELFWLAVVPMGLVGSWLISTTNFHQFDWPHGLIFLFLFCVAYAFLLPFSSFVGSLLKGPFVLIANESLGLNIVIKKSRRH